ncbi:hypothetical protein SeLEV6574_g01838 [Synchytrium endobioticum]|nr:hypothetical protein SeLEV6574_g01838 [Synchytrium endobioticum]
MEHHPQMTPRTARSLVALLVAACLVPTAVSAFDQANATASLQSLCHDMPGMPGCYLKKLCDENPSALSEPYCHPISLVGAVCLLDMPRMKGCAAYNAECANNATCQSLYPAPASLPTSATLAQNIYSICNEMSMDGCDRCRLTPTSRYSECDMLEVYSNLCAAMPGMSQCPPWSTFCSSSPGMGSRLCNDGSDPSTQIPSMIMYFHTGLVEFILFKSWIPRTYWQYWLSMLALFLLSVVFEVFQAMHVILDMHLAKSAKPLGSKGTTTGPPAQKRTNWNHVLLKGLLRMVHATFAYALMLVTMTYNVGLFFSVIVGLGVGNMLSAPLIKSAENAMGGTSGDPNWELCC